jgi:hypothetical protein
MKGISELDCKVRLTKRLIFASLTLSQGNFLHRKGKKLVLPFAFQSLFHTFVGERSTRTCFIAKDRMFCKTIIKT